MNKARTLSIHQQMKKHTLFIDITAIFVKFTYILSTPKKAKFTVYSYFIVQTYLILTVTTLIYRWHHSSSFNNSLPTEGIPPIESIGELTRVDGSNTATGINERVLVHITQSQARSEKRTLSLFCSY